MPRRASALPILRIDMGSAETALFSYFPANSTYIFGNSTYGLGGYGEKDRSALKIFKQPKNPAMRCGGS
jgi:hypothetical protein